LGIITLTKVDPNVESLVRDRPVEIEVTPAMIAAGLKVYEDWLPYDAPRSSDEIDLLAGCFLAMYARLDE
jgi:hypothetical protein